MSAALLSLRGVRKSYGSSEVVCGVDLELTAGECFGLLGPNGAGKTTTLRLALGLTTPDAGEIFLLGHPVPGHACEARMRAGVVPQTDNLDPDFTTFENLLVYGRYFGMDDAEIQHAFHHCSSLPDWKRARCAHPDLVRWHEAPPISGACAGQRPRLIFLDEPTTGSIRRPGT